MNFLSSFRSSSNRSRTYRGIVTFTVLVIGIGWAVGVLYLRDARQREIAHLMQANANLARAFEEHTIRTIKQIDQLVLLISTQYQRLGAKLDLARFAREAGVNPELVVIIAVLDEHGDALLTNTPAPPANVADRDHFKFHSQHDSGELFVGKAVMGRLGGRWLMPMSRRVNKPDGSFGGAVSIGVDPLYFSNFYRDIDLGKEGVVTLGGRDGFIRSRLSAQQPGAGQDVRNTPIVNAIEHSPRGSLIFTSIVDGISRIWSYRALRDYPLYVTVGVSEKEALVTHDRLRRGSYVAAGFVTILVLAFCGWLLRLDIREQSARAALIVTEQRQAALLDSIPDNAWFKDGDGRFLAVNRAYARSLGIEPEAAIGKTTRDLIPADAAERSTDEDQQVLSSGNSLRIERKLFFGNNLAWYDVIKVPIKDRHGRAIGVVCIARDITERRAAQAEVETLNAKLHVVNEALQRRVAERTAELEIANGSLRESEAHYRAVAQSANDAIVTADVAGNIVGWNRSAEIIFGYTEAEINGQPLTLLMPYLCLDRHLADMNRVHSDGKPNLIGTTVELKGLRKDKSEFPLELSLAKWEIAEGRFITGIVRDITGRKRLEEMHFQAQKLESLGTLAGGIAHDFNNILAAIRGNVDLAAEDVGPDHVARQSLEEIRKAATRASELVRRIMAFGRPTEAKQEVVDLSVVVGEVLKLLRSTLPAGISLQTEFAKDTPLVLADAGQVHEAMVNLTTNAAYAIDGRAGSIEYRLAPVRVEEDLAGSIPGLKPGCYARLTVKDNGCGMDAATLGRIFDVFYTTKPQGEGTGLGLSMVHGIMRSHGGAVTVESALGKGSSFHLYFPAAEESAVKEGNSVSARGLPAAGQRVLYVDDEEALVLLAERFLARSGHSVSGFTDPEAALAAFRAHPQDYDVVVTDLSMPHMSGFDLARAVLAVRPEIPVLMTTGYVRAEDEVTVRDIGIRELVLKPTTMDELAHVLDRLLRGGELDAKPSA